MAGRLDGCRIAFLTANEGVEQVELTEPWQAVRDEGGQPVLLAPEPGPVQAFNHLDKGDVFTAEMAVADADPADFDALVLPGGVANPDQLRTEPKAVNFVHRFAESGRTVAVICHGPWTMIDAGVVEGRHLTSWPSVRTDLVRAGAKWSDEPVVIDGNYVSSRKPDDLPDFCAALVDQVASAGQTAPAGQSAPQP
jgi:protease I